LSACFGKRKKLEILKLFKSLVNIKLSHTKSFAIIFSNPLYILRQHDVNPPVNAAMVRNRDRKHVTCYVAARARQSLARQASGASDYQSFAPWALFIAIGMRLTAFLTDAGLV
jgi:hypothetical protein